MFAASGDISCWLLCVEWPGLSVCLRSLIFVDALWPRIGDMVITPHSRDPVQVMAIDRKLGNVIAVYVPVTGYGNLRVLLDVVFPARDGEQKNG